LKLSKYYPKRFIHLAIALFACSATSL
jgi:hypothetical protein